MTLWDLARIVGRLTSRVGVMCPWVVLRRGLPWVVATVQLMSCKAQ